MASPFPRGTAILKMADWPVLDRQLWEQWSRPVRSPFSEDGGARKRSPYSVTKVANGYGRFLGYINHEHVNLLDVPPRERLTPAILDGYFEHLCDIGSSDSTLVCYFDDLRRAMTWMHPGEAFQFVTMPHGVPLAELLQMKCKNAPAPHTKVFLGCARQLFAEAMAENNLKRRRLRVRDAVMIGIFATAAPRIETLSRLELDRHVRRKGNEWWLEFTPDILKTGKHVPRSLEVPVDPEVDIWLSHYIDVDRFDMVSGRQHRSLWVTAEGTPLNKRSIAARVRGITERYLGKAYGTHAFRVALATSHSVDGSLEPEDSRILLFHTHRRITDKHYNRANAMNAGRRHAARLKNMRRDLGNAIKDR